MNPSDPNHIRLIQEMEFCTELSRICGKSIAVCYDDSETNILQSADDSIKMILKTIQKNTKTDPPSFERLKGKLKKMDLSNYDMYSLVAVFV